METKKTHKQILESILRDKNLSKGAFAETIGYTKNNYTTALNKEYYSNKLLAKICKSLNIDVKVFENPVPTEGGISQVINGNGNTISQNIHLKMENDLLREQLKAKDKIIELLEQSLKNKTQ